MPPVVTLMHSEVDPLLHAYVVYPEGTHNSAVPPEQTLCGPVIVVVMLDAKVTSSELLAVQPLPSVIVTVYVPVELTLMQREVLPVDQA